MYKIDWYKIGRDLTIVLATIAVIFGIRYFIGNSEPEVVDPEQIAIQIAFEEFGKLGETVEKEELKVTYINNENTKEERFYITSPSKNTIDIRKSDFAILKINNEPIEND